MSKLKGKIALITGGNSGIGLATAKLYKEEGAQVIITARSDETFKKTQAEFGKAFDVVQADVSRLSDIEKLVDYVEKKYQRLDVLFANAGIAHFSPTEQVDEEFFDRHFDTNVKGLYFSVAKALPLLTQNGSIILTASVVAHKGFAGASVYSGTKAAVRNFARVWAAELAPRGIRVNVISPGPIETPIFGRMGGSHEQVEEMTKGLASQVPMGRLGRAEEIASVALFLASNDSSFMTGSEVTADGGTAQV